MRHIIPLSIIIFHELNKISLSSISWEEPHDQGDGLSQ